MEQKMSYPQYYHTLGVEVTASPDEIKAAYRKLAKKYHPDVNRNNKKAEEKLKKINEAYEVLGNLGKRAEYDYLGKQEEEAKKQSQQPKSPAYETYSPEQTTPHPSPQFKKRLIIGIFLFIYLNWLIVHYKEIPQIVENWQNTIIPPAVSAIQSLKEKTRASYIRQKKQLAVYAVKNQYAILLDSVLDTETKDAVDEQTGYSLLMLTDDIETAKKLLTAGVDPNYKAPDKMTAVNLAAKKNNFQMLSLLQKHGAKIN